MTPLTDIRKNIARVLIVDDERVNRQVLAAMLAPEGMILELAASGEEALAMIARQPPDLILLDVMMPGMDGYAVATSVKNNSATRSIPVIMITALDDRNARVLGLTAGAEDFLSKPVDRVELCVRVRNLLRLKVYGDYHDRYSQLLETEVALRTEELRAAEEERRALQAQFQQAQKMEVVGRLAAGVAHDFNNLLTVIHGFTELVHSDAAIGERHRCNLLEVMKASDRAACITKQLLAFGRQQRLSPAPLDLNELVRDMTAMLQRLAGNAVRISLRLAPDLLPTFADGSQLGQVIMNLVVNARDAMPEGGDLLIETQNVDLDYSAFHKEAVVPGVYVMVAVTDTGTGMTKEVQQRLFEPFFTTKEVGKGTGLGLSTTYGIVQQTKGHIWVDSALGHGTTFRVYLPQMTDDAISAAAAAPRSLATQKSCTG